MTNKGQSEKFFFSSPIVYNEDEIFISTSISTYSINAANGVLKHKKERILLIQLDKAKKQLSKVLDRYDEI